MSAITKLSGIDFDQLSDEKKREMNSLPAMVYHGVNTSEAVLMRMNDVPRSIAPMMGAKYAESAKDHSVQEARAFVRSLSKSDWENIRDKKASLSGEDYKAIWELLSGE